MTKEWLEQKAAYEARIEGLVEEIKTLHAGVTRPGIYIVDEAPSKVIVPGPKQPGGLKIVVSGLNPHQAMHALIQGMAYVHQQIMSWEVQMTAQAAKAGQMGQGATDGIRLVQ